MISPKENMLKLYKHEMPEYLPQFGIGIQAISPINGIRERPLNNRAGKDWFGVNWLWLEGDPAPVPDSHPLLEDICDWETAVHFPDLDSWNWADAPKIDRLDKFDRENNLFYFVNHNGPFERMHALLGFENSLMALLTEPEEVGRFLSAMVEYKCRLIEKIAKYYRPDILAFHDDYGTQRAMFFSPGLWRELFKERLRKIIDCAHENGLIFEFHCCGFIEDIIPDMCEIGVDALQIMPINDIPKMKKITAGKVVYDVYIDMQKYEVLDSVGKLTEDILRQGIREEIMKMAEGGCYLPNIMIFNDKWLPIIHDEINACRKILYQNK
ncbi:Uroporphyrinogen decarboxylase (URO-D) [Sporobacter termitidis DSM 10068]|uniref:Uroporphyrinogen decarboxylase (URO-D) n=1 Tax=Sporobacter termitidis DSM 10068 TaxID=1123282 RepID=A0A1M5X851_9FIRM|nr:uroporphyrinogen decarboxylase family protein [Sporobacter termitidis]SHH95393.1 Uroporphyrinogen decarboxylase (URO-D) [Sporobacter termitidis DSM 10068]